MARTVAQLQDTLGEYVKPGGDFKRALLFALDRLYQMGTWRDTTEEVTLDGSLGYIALADVDDSVLAATVNHNPRPVRSLWHDVRIYGKQAQVSAYTGIVDDGLHPVALDMKDVQGVKKVEDVVPLDTLLLVRSGAGAAAYPSGFTGSVTIVTDSVSGGAQETTSDDTGTVLQLVAADDFTKILNISYSGVKVYLDLIDPEFPDQVIATVPPGSGVLRVRRFRTSSKTPETRIHLLVKRACPKALMDETIVHLSNISALKQGLLGTLYDDAEDPDRAKTHWDDARGILDTELASFMGQAKPTLKFGDVGAGPIRNFL
jgi:hypothetical protein